MKKFNSHNILEKFNHYLSNYWFLFYILVIFTNLVIRLIGLQQESLYGDEGFSVFFAQQPIENLYERLLFDRNPPFYFFLLHFWIKLFGLNSIVLKSSSVLFSLGTAIFLVKISDRYFNKLTAILASILFILSNVWLMASHELRAFSLVGFLTVLSFYLYLNVLKRNKGSSAIGLTITNLLLVFSHYISFYIPILQFLCSFLFIKTNKKGYQFYLNSQLLALIIFIPWLKIVIENIPDPGSFWLATADFQNLYTVLTNLSGTAFIWSIHIIILGLFSLLLLIDRTKRFINKSFDIKLALILLVWYLFPILFNFFLAQFTPIFRLLYLLYASLGLFLLISYVVSVLQIHLILRISIIIILIYPVFNLFSPHQYVYEDWKNTVPKVDKLKDDNSVVLICDWNKHRSFTYYHNLKIFKDYDSIIPKLRKEQIHAISDSNSLKTVFYQWAEKIIYVRSHDNAGDPLNTNVSLLEKNDYKLCNKFGRDNLKVEVYLKDNIPCDSLKPVHFFPKEHCGIWQKSISTNFFNDTIISYFNDMELDLNCELKKNQTELQVYNGEYAAIVIDTLEYCSPLILPIEDIDTINIIDISFMALMEKFNSARVVVSIEGAGDPVFRTSYGLENSITKLNVWEKVNTSFKLPDNRGTNTELKVYLWNPDPSPVYIDNVRLNFKYLPIED